MSGRIFSWLRHRYFRLWGLLSLITTVLVIVFVVGAATCRPSWYEPAAVDPARLRTDKQELVELFDSIGDALNNGQAIRCELDEAQFNRWLAARDEIWPLVGFEFELEGASYPQIQLLEGNRLRFGFTSTRSPVSVVMSVTLRLELSGTDLLVHLEGVRAGALPIPRSLVTRALRTQEGALDLVDGATIRLPNDAIWPNGERPFRIESIEISAGRALVELAPLSGGP